MRLFDMDSREDYLLDGKYRVATPYAPLINVVEVVRCKDCKHWKEWENGTGHCGRSENPHFWFGSDADDFCSFGEKGEKMEQMLIDALRMAPNKDIQAILLETYIQEYGAVSDENGEIVRQILMERREE